MKYMPECEQYYDLKENGRDRERRGLAAEEWGGLSYI